jgi:hypothetical protein
VFAALFEVAEIAPPARSSGGDPISVVETLTMKDDDAAAAMKEKVPLLMERFAEQTGSSELFEKLGPPEMTVEKNVVTSLRKIPLSALPSLDVMRTKFVADAREGR